MNKGDGKVEVDKILDDESSENEFSIKNVREFKSGLSDIGRKQKEREGKEIEKEKTEFNEFKFNPVKDVDKQKTWKWIKIRPFHFKLQIEVNDVNEGKIIVNTVKIQKMLLEELKIVSSPIKDLASMEGVVEVVQELLWKAIGPKEEEFEEMEVDNPG